MRVAMYYNNEDIRIEEMPTPGIGPGELLLRIEASGICGSDVMEWYRLKRAPLVLGHEIAGEVVEAGKGIDRYNRGDRVVASHHVPCNTCRYCLSGHHTVCDTLRRTNFVIVVYTPSRTRFPMKRPPLQSLLPVCCADKGLQDFSRGRQCW
jgi:L-iditol 2-dehydrogenase